MKKQTKNNDAKLYFMPIGMCLGMILGTIIGVKLKNLAIVLVIAIGIGTVGGLIIDKIRK